VIDPATALSLVTKLAKLAVALEEIGQSHDRATKATFDELMHDCVVSNSQGQQELQERIENLEASFGPLGVLISLINQVFDWDQVPDHERPLFHDIVEAVHRYSDDYANARSNAKRKLLFSGLVGAFNPKFHCEGWSRIWEDRARRLEPPHVALLRELWEEYSEADGATKISGLPKRMNRTNLPLLVDLEREAFVSLKRMGTISVWVSAATETFLEFLWDYDREGELGSGSS